MILFTLTKYATQWLAPRMLRLGIAARNRLPKTTSYYYDILCGIPIAQKLLTLSIYDQCAQNTTDYHKQQQKKDDTGNIHKSSTSSSRSNIVIRPFDCVAIADLRIKVLDELLKPALLPTMQLSDIEKWDWNSRILKWVRQEVLIAKYGPLVKEALDAYPQLRTTPQFSRHPTERMLLNLARGRLDWGSSNTISDNNDYSPSSTSSSTSNNTNSHGRKKTNHPRQPQLLLPSSETILKAFSMRHWATTKHSVIIEENYLSSLLSSYPDFYAKMTGDAHGDDNDSSVSTSSSIAPSAMSMPDILDCATGGSGGLVNQCGPLNTVCEEANIYQLWTKEYVQHLGDYLLRRAREYDNSTTTSGSTLILDIGAGDGLLLHYLQQHCHQEQRRRRGVHSFPQMDWKATDDGSWRIFAKAKVEKLNVQQSLKKYVSPTLGAKNNEDAIKQQQQQQQERRTRRQQVIIICSWMPMDQDWTQMFRDANVEEYILIGEADDGSCGDNWATWGNLDFLNNAHHSSNEGRSSIISAGGNSKLRPAYEQDGYKRWDMDILAPFQFSRFDCASSKSGKTVSFRRRRGGVRGSGSGSSRGG